MTLRLVLVGIVAALGVSIPSQPSGDHWFDSAEAWAISLLAEWDTWEPSDGGGADPAGKRDHPGCEECRLARLRVAANAMRAVAGDPPAPKGVDIAPAPEITASLGESKSGSPDPKAIVGRVQPTVSAAEHALAAKAKSSVAFEPIRVSEPFESGIAYELNRGAEGLGELAAASAESVAVTTDSEIDLPADAFELGVWDSLYQIATKPLELAKPSVIERSDDELVPCLDEEWVQAGCLDDAEAAWDDAPVFADLPRNVFAPADRIAAASAIREPAVMPAFGLLAYLARSASATVASPAPTALKPNTGQFPAIGNLVYLSVRYASASSPAASPRSSAISNNESARPSSLVDLPSDVFAPAPAVVVQEPLPRAGAMAGRGSQPARLGDAVELTRRAVSAWVSVLIGPALVDVSRR
jgi:hypothetical protein